jgi:hypothetical protein
MPRILAIDWDRREARAIALASGPTGITVTGAWAVSLATVEPAGLSGQQIGARLAAAMGGQPTGKFTTLVGVGRDNVQMQLLSLPPAPPEELPDLVRFQADREFTALGSDAALDFIPISGDAQTPNQVLAIALTSEGLTEARELCAALGLEPNRIPLRPCAAAALVLRAGVIGADEVVLIVNPLIEEADLTVQWGERVVLMRTVRLPDPGQALARQRALSGEIRRTMAAVRQQLVDRNVDHIIVCGDATASELALVEEVETPITVFDPVAHGPSTLARQDIPAESLARFAAVLGMALSESDRRPPVIDFANVRRQPTAKRFTRTHVLAAVAAAALVFWFASTLWRQLYVPSRELAELNEEIQKLQSEAEVYKDVTAQAAAVERWLATDVNWLDELEQFARRVRPKALSEKDFPAEDDVVVTQLILTKPPAEVASGGRLLVNAVAKSDAALRQLEQRLAAGPHRVVPGRVQRDMGVPGYPRSTDLEIHVQHPESQKPETSR